MLEQERLQKALAAAGLGSRRQVEEWIREGRIRVNGKLAELGMRVSSEDRVELDGRAVPLRQTASEPPRVLLYNKPEGEVTTRSDPQGRPTVFDHLPRLSRGRWITIGRLDINTLGLLLFTNEGDLAHRLMHPSQQIEREYAVRVRGVVDDAALAKLRAGVELEDGPARFEDIQETGGTGANRWFHVVIREGRTREVRRLWESQGVSVSRLMRVRFGPVSLPRGLRRGQWRELEREDVEKLRLAVGLTPLPARQVAKPRTRRSKKSNRRRHGGRP